MDKIFDILPPREKQTPFLKKIQEEKLKEQNKSYSKKEERQKEKIPFFKKFWPIVFFVLSLIFLFSYFFIETNADVEIWLDSKISNFKTTLEINTEILENDNFNNIIKGDIIEAEGFASKEFSSTGKLLKEKKSYGIIRVYNNYSTIPQPLIATTRFISAEGKLFRTPKRIVIPGASYDKKGKLIPGFIDIEVIADEPGPEYNIGSTTFSIPGFSGTKKYYSFYGKSFESTTGGEIKEVSQITKEDIKKSEKALMEIAEQKSINSLESKVSSGLIVLKDAKETEIIDISSSATEGQELETFVSSIKVKTKTFVFEKKDLEDFTKSFVFKQISQYEKFQEEQLETQYYIEKVDFKKGKVILRLEISAKIYSLINENEIIKLIKEKNPDQAKKEILEKFYNIKKVKIKLFPFWAKNSPKESKKIKISQKVAE